MEGKADSSPKMRVRNDKVFCLTNPQIVLEMIAREPRYIFRIAISRGVVSNVFKIYIPRGINSLRGIRRLEPLDRLFPNWEKGLCGAAAFFLKKKSRFLTPKERGAE